MKVKEYYQGIERDIVYLDIYDTEGEYTGIYRICNLHLLEKIQLNQSIGGIIRTIVLDNPLSNLIVGVKFTN